MILHCSSISDGPNGSVRVAFKVLNPVPTPIATPDTTPPVIAKNGPRAELVPPPAPYPGYTEISNFQVTLSAVDAAAFTRGAKFTLTAK